MKIQQYDAGIIGTNCYLVWDEASGDAMIVDPGGFVPQIEEAVSAEGLVVKYIVLTHGHGDHTGGVAEFRERYPDTLLAAGEKEAGLLTDSEQNLSRDFSGDQTAYRADIWLKEGDELVLGDLHFLVFETPGHTPGGITLYTADGSAFSGTALGANADGQIGGVAITGDTLFQGSIGRTDLPGGDYRALEESIRKKLYALPEDTAVLPGHMGFTTIGYEAEHNPFVRK
ncbi:MBL fold metallo-hydrolase [Clostridia bacterium]|nr:MBL fold metallo-hydrolase [Clostridia bacterium]